MKVLVALGVVLGISLLYPRSVDAGAASSLMDISTDGRLLACSNRDSGTVSIVDLSTHSKTHEIPVGHHPEGVSFLGNSHRLAVAVHAEDVVVFLDADRGVEERRIPVFDEPYGVVSNSEGNLVYVTLDYPGQILEIDARSGELRREMAAGKFLRGLAITPDSSRLYATEYYTAQVVSVDLQSGMVNDRWPGVSNDNLARQIILHPTRPKAYLTHIRSRVTAVHGEGSIFPYLSVLGTDETDPNAKARRRRIPMDSFRGALVTANPWDCAISADGKRFYIVFAGTDDMFVCDVLEDNYKEIGYQRYMEVGHNPRAVRESPDGQTLYVYNALDFNIVAYDTKEFDVKQRISVTDCPMEADELRGKQLFYSAREPMASRRWISCSSCHPDGEPDGRTWHNPEGLRNTQALGGMAWTHPIHWSADRDEVQDFEHTIRGKLMQGRGLLRGQLQAELGSPNAGLSHELDALALYSNSHALPMSPHAKQGLSEAALRGRALFFDASTRCATCHGGPFYTDSQPRSAAEIVRHNVGTGGGDDEKMGPEYDTPSLLGVYRTAPYLHHGRAETLHDVLTTFNQGDVHGVTSHLTPAQVDDLVEFLKCLPYEDPESAAVAAGMKKVER